MVKVTAAGLSLHDLISIESETAISLKTEELMLRKTSRRLNCRSQWGTKARQSLIV